MYILRLSTEVDWDDEKACLDGICRETARFYSRAPADAEIGAPQDADAPLSLEQKVWFTPFLNWDNVAAK